MIIIVPKLTTTIGYWLMHEPAFQINLLCEPLLLGSMVVKALELSKQNILPPEKHSRAFPSYLKEATGLTKWKDFEKSCTHLDLYQDEDNIVISNSFILCTISISTTA